MDPSSVTLRSPSRKGSPVGPALKPLATMRVSPSSCRESSKSKENDEYEAAKRRALARKPFLKTQGRYLSRERSMTRARSSVHQLKG
jgi:hypothetical protein